jgi:excisionase family DNA binding protein
MSDLLKNNRFRQIRNNDSHCHRQPHFGKNTGKVHMNSKIAQRERMLSVRETAQVLGLCLDSVRRHLRSGKMPGVRVGRNWRIPESQLSVYMGIASDEDQTYHTEKSVTPKTNNRSGYTRENAGRGAARAEAESSPENEVVEALFRTHPARTKIMALVKDAASGAEFSPDEAQHLLKELNHLLREL